MEFSHIPVLLEQAVDALAIKENGIYVDGTAGGGGHSSEILKHLTTGKLISIDQDPDAILTLTERFKKNENSIIIKGNFADMVGLLHSRGVGRVDGVLLDDELGVLERGLDGAFELLGSGGRLAVITFHSLEDRIVKQKMALWCQGCTCPKDFPVCVCGNKPKAKLVVKKPICANETELSDNPRARSAKLRICEKI